MDNDRPGAPGPFDALNRATHAAGTPRTATLDAELTARYLAKRCLTLEDANAELTAHLQERASELAGLHKELAQLRYDNEGLTAERDLLVRSRRALADTLSGVRNRLHAAGGEGVSDAATRVYGRVAELERDLAKKNVVNTGLESLVEKARDRMRELEEQLKVARYERDRLCAETMQLKAKATAPYRVPAGAYLIREPGVYVATPVQEEPGLGQLAVAKYPLGGCVVLTAEDGSKAKWWAVERDGITGAVGAWAPPEPVQTDVHALVKHHLALKGTPWMGVDPGKPGDDRTDGHTVIADPVVDPSLTGRLARLEAWAKQFDALTTSEGIDSRTFTPLAAMQP